VYFFFKGKIFYDRPNSLLFEADNAAVACIII
jgi:hypothetical protein